MLAAFCSPVPVPTNGAVHGYRYELNATLRITCNDGYNMVPSSSSFRTCITDGGGGGQWSGQDPVCECKTLPGHFIATLKGTLIDPVSFHQFDFLKS